MSSQESQAPSSSRLGTLGLSVWQYGRNAALSAAEYMTPVLVESQFATKGVLTPEEFVAAGDMLVLRCPTWQWQAGDPANARPFLPPDKQFLLTRNVPCQRRACALAVGADDEEAIDGGDDNDDWVATHASHAAKAVADDDVPDMDAAVDLVEGMTLGGGGAAAGTAGAAAAGGSSTAAVATTTTTTAPAAPAGPSAAAAEEAGLEEFGAIEGEDACVLDADDFDTLANDDATNIVRARSYDVSITYDKYYQCARVWLYGYTEERQPLTQGQILEDISVDHALKTVTLEAHPHISTGAGLHASIHPCKHPQVMHKLSSEMAAAGRKVTPEHYLFLFLKFISSVCPTIEYDYTVEV